MNVREFETVLGDAEVLLDRLRGLYEQWFQGVERLEPTIPKKDMERKIRAMRRAMPRNTALRFRFNRLVQRYTTYMTYWKRVARQIEEGTYRRDVLKARQRRQNMRAKWKANREGDDAGPKAYELDIDVDVDLGDLAGAGDAMFADTDVGNALDALSPQSVPSGNGEGAQRSSLSPFAFTTKSPPAQDGTPSRTFGVPRAKAPSDSVVPMRRDSVPVREVRRDQGVGKPARTVPQQRPPPSPAQVQRSYKPPPPAGAARPKKPAGEEAQIRGVYDRYVEARRRNNERTDNLKYENVKKSIKKMLPKLQEKHKGKKIDFEVVVKNGKVGIKPVPK